MTDLNGSAHTSPKLVHRVASETHSQQRSPNSKALPASLELSQLEHLDLRKIENDIEKKVNKDNDQDIVIVEQKSPDKMPLTDILQLFDLAVAEIRRLMRTDSLARFINTKQYHEFYKQFGKSIVSERSNKVNKDHINKQPKLSMNKISFQE